MKTLVLLATILSVDGGTALLDRGRPAGLQPGDTGLVYHEPTLEGATRRVEIGTGSVFQVEDRRSRLRLAAGHEARPGYLVEFQIPQDRFVAIELGSASELEGRLVRLGMENAYLKALVESLQVEPEAALESAPEAASVSAEQVVRLQAERQDLADRLAAAQASGSELATQVDALKTENESLGDRLTASEASAADLQGELRDQLDRLNEDNRRLLAEGGSAREELESRETEHDQLTAINTKLTSEIATLREQVAELRNDLALVSASLATAQAESTQTAELNDSLEERIGELQRRVSLSRNSEETLQTAAGELERLNASLEARIADLEAETAAAQESLSVALSQIESLEEEREAATAALAAARTAAPPQPALVPAELPESDSLEDAVRAWAAAWSEQRVDDYLAFYATEFRPGNGQSRAAWAKRRRERIEAPASIEVALDDFEVLASEPGRARVRFEQSYRSESFSDQVTKTLELIADGDDWKIVGETSSPL